MSRGFVLAVLCLCAYVLATDQVSIVILGASGDLAKRKIFPALFSLYEEGLLPQKFNIIGYARSALTDSELVDRVQPFLHSSSHQSEFFKHVTYVQGAYDKQNDYENLSTKLATLENGSADRIFYLSLPPNVFLDSANYLNKHCRTTSGYNRIIVEKPFGRDLKTFHELSQGLNTSFVPEEIYRIDHFVGKEVAQSILPLRFNNAIFEPLWNNNHVQSIQILFKEKIGCEGRGGYFDSYGMIRDVMQNHLMQLLALICMDKPTSMSASDIRAEKIKLLRQVQALTTKDVVVGQYEGYKDDPTVDPNSIAETYAAIVLHVNNDRWKNVPVIMKAGKALNERLLEIVLQFKQGNELVIRIQPDESVYFRVNTKGPGYKDDPIETKLVFDYKTIGGLIPEAYAKLIYDAIQGKSSNFVTEEEINLCWIVFDDLLEKLESLKVKPVSYVYGGKGPVEATKLVKEYGLHWSDDQDTVTVESI
jgi:glucose-6-phosphate 1-dehydrogenase